jgi:hypothetical protein
VISTLVLAHLSAGQLNMILKTKAEVSGRALEELAQDLDYRLLVA